MTTFWSFDHRRGEKPSSYPVTIPPGAAGTVASLPPDPTCFREEAGSAFSTPPIQDGTTRPPSRDGCCPHRVQHQSVAVLGVLQAPSATRAGSPAPAKTQAGCVPRSPGTLRAEPARSRGGRARGRSCRS